MLTSWASFGALYLNKLFEDHAAKDTQDVGIGQVLCGVEDEARRAHILMLLLHWFDLEAERRVGRDGCKHLIEHI